MSQYKYFKSGVI